MLILNSLLVNMASATSAKSGASPLSSQKFVVLLVSSSNLTTKTPSVSSKVTLLFADWSGSVCWMRVACVLITCLPSKLKISWNDDYKHRYSRAVWPNLSTMLVF